MAIIFFVPAFVLMAIATLFLDGQEIPTEWPHPTGPVTVTSRYVAPVFRNHPGLAALLWVPSIVLWLLSMLAAFAPDSPGGSVGAFFGVYAVAVLIFAVGKASPGWGFLLAGGGILVLGILSIVRGGLSLFLLVLILALGCIVLALADGVPKIFRLLGGLGFGVILAAMMGAL